MYLHLGQAVVVPEEEIIGVFDLDNASWSPRTRQFLERAEKEGRVVNAASDLPRSFVLRQKRDKTSLVYLSQLSSATLKGRADGNEISALVFGWPGGGICGMLGKQKKQKPGYMAVSSRDPSDSGGSSVLPILECSIQQRVP